MTALLSTTYFGPVQWYQKLHRHQHVLIEMHESFAKQTYRNRCLIATAQGVLALTVPVAAPSRLVGDIRLSNHGHWQHQHWQAITSAYGDTPFFEYYEDDLRPFFFETERWERLVDYNEAIRQTVCSLIDIHPDVKPTASFISTLPASTVDSPATPGNDARIIDYRNTIRPKHAPADPAFTARPYYQVFSSRQGFLPNLSILDLLLNMGPESVFYL